jgi:hypothetical protein
MTIFEWPSKQTRFFPLMLITILILPALLQGQPYTDKSVDPLLTPWFGVWTIVDDQQADIVNEQSLKPTVEISPTEDGKGLNINRKVSQKPDVQEIVIPDGVRRPIQSKNCTGWQTSKWLPEAGLILGSSDIACKESESYSVSNLRMIVSPDRMIDILTIKASGQTRIAVRHLIFSADLASSTESPGQRSIASRISVSAPWDLDTIIKLSKIIDASSFQAALLEKNTKIKLNPKSLKQMTVAEVPKPVIDLLVAQAFPEKFFIEQNGQVAVSPSIKTRDSGSDIPTLPSAAIYPVYGYGGYYPFGYLGNYAGNFYWTYYSPFWYGYPIYFYNMGNSGGSGGSAGSPGPSTGGQLSANRGYVQITPRDTGRQAVPIHSPISSSGRFAGYSQAVTSGAATSGGGYSSSGASSSGGYSTGGGTSSSGSSSGGGASASPAGYSSGSSSGAQAVPR